MGNPPTVQSPSDVPKRGPDDLDPPQSENNHSSHDVHLQVHPAGPDMAQSTHTVQHHQDRSTDFQGMHQGSDEAGEDTAGPEGAAITAARTTTASQPTTQNSTSLFRETSSLRSEIMDMQRSLATLTQQLADGSHTTQANLPSSPVQHRQAQSPIVPADQRSGSSMPEEDVSQIPPEYISQTTATMFSLVMRLGGVFDRVQQLEDLHLGPPRSVVSSGNLMPEGAVAALPTRHLLPSECGKNHSLCGICRQEKEEGDEVMVLPCGHWFDMACIAIWLQEHRVTCPVCRRAVMEV
jgi:hypothetical protein